MREIFEKTTKGYKIEVMPMIISMEFNVLHQFTNQTTSLYKNLQEKLAKTIAKIEKRKSKDKQFLKRYLEDQNRMRYRMEGIFLASAFVSCVSLFEFLLQEICEIAIDKEKITPDEIQGRFYILKSKTFLIKVVGIDLKDSEDAWEKLKTYSEIRNKLVHQQGRLKKTDGKESDLCKKLKSMPGVKITSSEPIAKFRINDPEFIVSYMRMAGSYLETIAEKVRIKMLETGMADVVE